MFAAQFVRPNKSVFTSKLKKRLFTGDVRPTTELALETAAPHGRM